MKKLGLQCSILLLFSVVIGVNAQNYRYEVRTLLEESSHIIDDGLCLDENGTLYGSYWGIWQGTAGTHVARYHSKQASVDTLATGFTRPNGISYKDGKIYVANGGGSRVMAIDTNGVVKEVAIVWGVSNVISKPNSTDLTATAWGGKKIYNIDATGRVTTISESSLYNGPVGATYDADGNLYVGNFNDGKILKADGNQVELFVDLRGGIGFLTYSDGAILATNHTDKKVYRIDIATKAIEVIAGSGQAVIKDGIGIEASFKSPNGIVATPSGDTIYVSEFAGKALRVIIRAQDSVSSSNDLVEQPKIKLYPTPTSGKINLEYESLKGISKGILRDSTGKLIREVSLVDIQNRALDFSGLSTGTYIFSLLDQQTNVITSIQIPIIK